MKVFHTKLKGLLLIEPNVFSDARGFFMETWNRLRYSELGIPTQFKQDNLSLSSKGTLRGLHFQDPNPQGKLVYVLSGEAFDVVVDIRKGSRTFGQWESFILSSRNRKQLYVPKGFAHGFCALSDQVLFAYKCTNFYSPKNEKGIRWDDSDLKIPWPTNNPIVSGKDCQHPLLRELEGKLTAHYQ